MKSKLISFAHGLSFPADAATQTIAFLARKRAGKSYAAGKLAEGMYANDVQFVVLDPVGNWYGLRVAADGKGEGLANVILLGGLRGDIPLDPNAGALVADTVLDSGRSFVLDVSQFSLGERKRFVQAFGERLWHRQKALKDPRPLHVFLEEAQLFIPQNPQPEERPMLGIWCEIVRLGGNKGIGVTIISQRPQSVSKEALTQVECLVVLQVSGVPEKKALKEWIVEQVDAEVEVEGGTKVKATDLLKELPFLKQGIAYVWSPQWLGHFGKHQVLPKWTYDASATPKVGVKRVQAEVKPIDLEELRSKMSETVKKLEENDPRALKRRIGDLEKQLVALMQASQKQLASPVAQVQVKTVEVPVLREKELKLFEKHLKLAAAITDRLNQSAQVIATEANNLATVIKSKAEAPASNGSALRHAGATAGYAQMYSKPQSQLQLPAPKPVPAVKAQPPQPVIADEFTGDDTKKLGRGARDMLKATASRHPTRITKGQAATLARVPPRKSTFRNAMSELRVGGFVEEHGDELAITQKGLEYLGDDVQMVQPTTENLMEMWGRRFPTKVNEALKVIVESHPQPVTHVALGERIGVDIAMSTYRNLLSKLRSNSLIVTDKESVRASDTLFPQ